MHIPFLGGLLNAAYGAHQRLTSPARQAPKTEGPRVDITQLPVEILVEIQRHLPTRTVCAPVNRAWCAAAKTPVLWKRRIADRGWPMPPRSADAVAWEEHFKVQYKRHGFREGKVTCFLGGSRTMQEQLATLPVTLPALVVENIAAWAGPQDLPVGSSQPFVADLHLIAARLPYLRDFAYRGALRPEHLAALQSLAHLESLEVKDGAFDSALATAIVTTFPNLRALSIDCVPGPSVATLRILSQLQNLEILNIDRDSDLEQLPATFARLTKLRRLKIGGERDMRLRAPQLVADIAEHIPQLEALDLSGRAMRDGSELACLAKLTGLKELRLRECWVGALPVELGVLPMEILDVSGYRVLYRGEYVPMTIPSAIGNIKTLRQVNVEGCGLTRLPAGWDNLPNLEDINLASNSITLPKVLKWPRIQTVNLFGCELTSLPAALTSCTTLRRLSLSCDSIGSLPYTFGNLQRLEALDLSSTGIKQFPRGITLPALRWLTLPREAWEKLPDLPAVAPNLQWFNPGVPINVRTPGADVAQLPQMLAVLQGCKSLHTVFLDTCSAKQGRHSIVPRVKVISQRPCYNDGQDLDA